MAFVVAVFAGWVIALPSLRKLARLNPLALFKRLLTRGLQSQVGLPLFHSGNPCLLGPHYTIRFLKLASLFFVYLLQRFFCTWHPRTLVSQVGIPQFQFAPPFGFPFPCPQPGSSLPVSLLGWGCCLV